MMLKKINKFLFHSTLAKKKILLKDIFFTDKNENISRAINLITKTNHTFDKNDLIIDIGAFDGETAKLFSKAFPKTNIIAFEANPKIYQEAVKNCIQKKNITIYNCAISDEEGNLSFNITNNNVSSSLNEINEAAVSNNEYGNELNVKNKTTVKTNKLDRFTGDNEILLIKIDTQGHEIQVLKGALQTLNRTRFILIEMSNHNMYIKGSKYHEIDNFLRKNNFNLADIIVTYRKKGIIITEYDAIYVNNKYSLF